MRKLILGLLMFMPGLCIGYFLGSSHRLAAAGGSEPCARPLRHLESGLIVYDVNGDERFDLSDPICLLSLLFLGTCSPRQLCPLGLPDTGQTICYNEAGRVIECTGGGCRGQDGFYATGCSSEGRFLDNGDGTVTDRCTGLVWQENTADVTGDGRIDGADAVTWCGALEYCDDLVFAEADDWRLPNVRELQSLIDYGRFGPAIDQAFHTTDLAYWSSSTLVGIPPIHAWTVFFSGGVVLDQNKRTAQLVRAVRGGF